MKGLRYLKVDNHYNHWLPKLLNVNGVTIGHHIYYQRTNIPDWLRRHEETHVRQYQVYGIFGFLFIYFYEYLRGRLKGLSHFEAYQDITFEIEARHNETLRR